MRARALLLTGLVAVLGSACQPLLVDNRAPAPITGNLDGGLDPEPSFATFEMVIQPFLTAHDCGECHDRANAPGGYLLVTMPDPDQLRFNHADSICVDRFDSFDLPAGKFLDYFCDDAMTPNAGHRTHVTTVMECTEMYAWAVEGTGGTPPDCP